jgi:4-amino-4-deoxy-L-arabinose transferase-like glycosyltransferase
MSGYLHFSYPSTLPLNEDEIAQGYNTYSVLKTGLDEYGKLPLRYLSFGENKLPLTGLLSAPFISIGGLTPLTIRFPLLLIGTFFPLALYVLAKSLWNEERYALVAALLASMNVWLVTMTRHQHEAPILALFVIFYLVAHIQYAKKENSKWAYLMAACVFWGLYTYHSAKVIMPGLALYTTVSLGRSHRNLRTILILFALSFMLFGWTEYIAPNNRLANTSYFTSSGFQHEIDKGITSGGSRLYYNKLVYGSTQLIVRSISYISPTFFLSPTEDNLRFAHPSVPLLTNIEYGLFILGTLLLILQRKKHWVLLIWLILLSVVPAVASRSTITVTRSFIFIIPIILLCSLALTAITRIKIYKPFRIGIGFVLCVVHVWFVVNTMSKYFTVYPNLPEVQRSWSVAMTEMAKYAWEVHGKYSTVYVSRRYGQGYIYFLMYGGPYDPVKYQKVAKPGVYDEYGFWQQDRLENFVFHLPTELQRGEIAIVHVDEMEKIKIQKSKLTHTIQSYGTNAFYVFEGI